MFNSSLSPDEFLRDYWQKKPLLFKGAIPNFSEPFSPEELAGLACEEEVESRLVLHENDSWQLKSGPFTEHDFTSLPASNWTLLVQAVDHWFTDLKKLYQHLDFLPDWRFDDIMASYATKDAGVGPHFDYYDVFILQGSGKRRWQLGQQCDENTALISDSPLKILQNFEDSEEYVLEAGDILYIPPGLAHQGISLGNSLSYSIGFRAPAYAEILDEYTALLNDSLTETQRYADPDLQKQSRPSEITADTLAKIKRIISDQMDNDYLLARSFGEIMTLRKYPEQQHSPEQDYTTEELIQTLQEGIILEKHPAARFAFHRQNDEFILFADGFSYELASKDSQLAQIADILCDRMQSKLPHNSNNLSKNCLSLICRLYNQGTLIES